MRGGTVVASDTVHIQDLQAVDWAPQFAGRARGHAAPSKLFTNRDPEASPGEADHVANWHSRPFMPRAQPLLLADQGRTTPTEDKDMRRLGMITATVACFAPFPPSHGASGPHLLDAVEAYDRGEHALAVTMLEALARQRNLDALYRLAEMTRMGHGVAKTASNEVAAYILYLAAARGGHKAAQTALGTGLLEEGSERQGPRGIAWLRKAAEEGYGPAQVALGLAYRQGTGVPRDPEQARDWLLRAATQGDRVAPGVLSSMYATGDLPADRPMMRLLSLLPTPKLTVSSDDGNHQVSDACGSARRYADASVNDGVVDRFFGQEDMLAFKEPVVVPAGDMQRAIRTFHGNRPGRPQYDYDVLHRHVDSTIPQIAEAQTRKAFAAQLTETRRGPVAMMVDKRTLAQKANMPVVPRSHKVTIQWHHYDLMVNWSSAIQRWYFDAAMHGNEQAQVALALMLHCGPAAGGAETDRVEALAWLHVADARGFHDARRLKADLRSAMTAGQIADAYATARRLWARIANP